MTQEHTRTIEARELRKTFGGMTAVNGLSFHVEPGEFFGLLGPNGAGKTSTIRMLYGFSPISGGSLSVFGLDIRREWRAIRARMGICQQDNTLDPDLTVEQNLHVFARYFNIPAREATRRASELLEFFVLDHRRDAKVMELSGGMIRRLILARSLINKPELLILDEPTTGLDPQSRHQVWEKLEELRAGGLTMLLTTHYMDEAYSLCDRLLIMDHGSTLVEGTPRELVKRHAGHEVIEIDEPDEKLRRFVMDRSLEYDDLGHRLIIYISGQDPVAEEIRRTYCSMGCTFRLGTLEDVFLRLTGRELRE